MAKFRHFSHLPLMIIVIFMVGAIFETMMIGQGVSSSLKANVGAAKVYIAVRHILIEDIK